MCCVLYSSRVFHINILIISAFYFGQYFELLLGKSLLIFYQYGYFAIPGISKTHSYLGWADTDTLQVPKIRRFEDALPMFIGSFLVWHYMMSMVFFIFFYNLERVIATFLLGNYEKHSRSYISISILIVANVLTLKISYMLFYFQIDFLVSAIVCSGAVVVAMAMYLSVMFYNMRLQSELKNDTVRKRLKKFDKYSLAYRFQLEENLKVFQLIKQVILAIGIYIFLNILCITIVNSNIFPESFNLTLVFLVENCLMLNPLLICTVTMYSVEPWRLILLRDIKYVLGGLGLKKFGKGGKVQVIKKPMAVEKGAKIQEETNIYFRDLKNMWA